jgi:hypothetical protein
MFWVLFSTRTTILVDGPMRLDPLLRSFELVYDGTTIGRFPTARECANAFHRHRTVTIPAVNIAKYRIKRGNELVGIRRLLRWAKIGPVSSTQRP